MDRFRTVGISRFQFWLILQICKDAIDLTSRQEVCFRHFFKNEVKKVLYKMELVSKDVLDHIERIYSHWTWKFWKFKNSSLSEISHQITKGFKT